MTGLASHTEILVWCSSFYPHPLHISWALKTMPSTSVKDKNTATAIKSSRLLLDGEWVWSSGCNSQTMLITPAVRWWSQVFTTAVVKCQSQTRILLLFMCINKRIGPIFFTSKTRISWWEQKKKQKNLGKDLTSIHCTSIVTMGLSCLVF